MKRKNFNIKSWIAALLCVTLLFTTFDFSICVQAEGAETVSSEEAAEESSEESEKEEEPEETEESEEEEKPEETEESEEEEEPEETEESKEEEESEETEETEEEEPEETEETGEEEESEETEKTEETEETEETELPDTETTVPEGVVLLAGFAPLSAEYANIVLEEKGTLDEVVSRMPVTLLAYAQVTDAATGEAAVQEVEIPVAWEFPGDYAGTDEESYIFRPVWNRNLYVYGENEAGGYIPEIIVSFSGREEEPEAGKAAVLLGFAPLPAEYAVITLEEKETLSEVTARMPASLRAYVEAPEAEEKGEGEESGTDTESAETETGEAEAQEAAETNTRDEGAPGADEMGEAEAEPVFQEAEVPVCWECTEDYENTALSLYLFRPVWDTSVYEYRGDTDIPVIRVQVGGLTQGLVVNTQEELSAALLAGEERITLAADIALTDTLAVPAGTDTVLDGQGYSLMRGQSENGYFDSTMICLGKEGDTEEIYATLTLTNIRIDGKTGGNRAAAPAVLDWGRLILDEGAVIRNNYNYGTYEDKIIYDYGGAVQVHGELIIGENTAITENFADELGGGVYLAPGAVLWFYADTLYGNQVSENAGYGADLYASNGSIIYYNPLIDMGRDGFYICSGAVLIDMETMLQTAADADGRTEIYLNVMEGSGYSTEGLKKKLEEELGVKVLTSIRREINTTDLRDWYVYDHYDRECWDQTDANGNGIPDTWEACYRDSPLRRYYGYTNQYLSGFKPEPEKQVHTIEEWIGNDAYLKDDTRYLTEFREHIYTTNKGGNPRMTFVGYDSEPNVDFLFYNPESDGEKVVDFDVDSSEILTHTLKGTGFLVNTGLSGDKLYGYLVYYTYTGGSSLKNPASANYVAVYQLNGVDVNELHRNVAHITGSTLVGKEAISGWNSQMSIQIAATPEKIIVRQQPKGEGGDIASREPILSCSVTDSGYSGFGPLVGYNGDGHTCARASSFTFSNLRMYFTNPLLEQKDLLDSLQEADFTQNGTKKYFLNLMGKNDGLQYNESASFGQYQEYLKLMQTEGVGLITDRETPFAPYLGASGSPNLCELPDGSPADVDQLVQSIKAYLEGQANTKWDENGGLQAADPQMGVGNIWLALDGKQIRSPLSGKNGNYQIEIKDISYRKEGISVSYEILKPDKGTYEPLSVDGSGRFLVSDNVSDWPAGQYVVRQGVENSSVCGYAYFELDRPAAPIPAPPVPTTPPVEEPRTPGQTYSHSDDTHTAAAVTAVPVVEPAVVTEPAQIPEPVVEITPDTAQAPGVSDGAPQPSTGEGGIPPMPVAMGACTVFMLKIMLWMYEMELGITEEKKNEMIRRLIEWAKGTSRLKIYTAVAAMAGVIVWYHLLKAVDAGRRRMVRAAIGR